MTIQEKATTLIEAVHADVDWSVWGKYRMKYWDIFTERVRLCARTTNDLSRFFSNLCARMGISTLGVNKKTRAVALDVLNADDGPAVLRCLREQADVVALRVRVENEKRKEKRAKEESLDSGEDMDGNCCSLELFS